MKDNRIKILWLILFVACAAVSCWATANSLHLLLPFSGFMNWLVSYTMAIVFMVVASLGSKLIVDSLTRGFQDNRSAKLAGGIILMLFFWLVCSMPTNTHTFFYEKEIEEVLINDLNKTAGYLEQLEDNRLEGEKLNTWAEQVEGATAAAEHEARNVANPGGGPKFQERISDLNSVLIQEQQVTLMNGEAITYTYGSSIKIPSKMSALQAVNYAREEANAQIKQANIKVNGDKEAGVVPIIPLDAKSFVPQADILHQTLKWYIETADSMQVVGGITNEFVEEVNVYLFKGYDCVNRFASYVRFDPITDAEIYHPESGKIVTATSRLKSVFDVWADYFKGRYKNMGMGYLILLSILIDVAAFIFFDLTFRKEDY